MQAPDRQWIFKEQSSHTPSSQDQVSQDVEEYHRGKAIQTCIVTVGETCINSPHLVLASAATLVHRFYMRQSISRYNPYVISLAALFLTAKVEEKPINLISLLSRAMAGVPEVFQVAKELEPITQQQQQQQQNGHSKNNNKNSNDDNSSKKPKDDLVQRLAKHVVASEHILLVTVQFDLKLIHPHSLLVETSKFNTDDPSANNVTLYTSGLKSSFFDWDADPPSKYLIQCAFGVLNECLIFPLWVLEPANIIACAAIVLAARQLQYTLEHAKIDLIDSSEQVTMDIYQYLGCSNDREKVLNLVQYIDSHYEKSEDLDIANALLTLSSDEPAKSEQTQPAPPTLSSPSQPPPPEW